MSKIAGDIRMKIDSSGIPQKYTKLYIKPNDDTALLELIKEGVKRASFKVFPA